MKRILVAEDYDSLRIGLVGCLQDKGYDVLGAVDGRHALEIFNQFGGIDLLMTDIRMPKLDGYGLIRELYRREQTFPIIVCTSIFDKDKVLYDGKLEFLPKPIDIDLLPSKIEELIE